LGRAIGAAGLPPPSALVQSGSGLHVYWISSRPLGVPEWRPYAEGLKLLAIRHELKFDAGLTTDEARVLRVPGTFNYKTTPPKAVVLKHLGQDYDFDVSLARLAAIGAQAPVVTATVTPQFLLPADFKPASPDVQANFPRQSLTAGLHEDRPLDPKGILLGCPHFREAATTNGAGFSQGLWMLDVLSCTFMDNGKKLAHYFSKGYDGYDPGETDAMWERKLADKQGGIGWPACKAFENEGCKHCATCPMKGQIRSPLNLADRKKEIPTAAQFAAPPPPPELDLPPGYTVDPNTGYICVIVTKKVEGELVEETVPLFRSVCRNFEGISDPHPDRHGLRWMVQQEKDNWFNVFIPQRLFQKTTELWEQLNKQRVLIDSEGKRYLEKFMVSFLERLNIASKRISTAPYGWYIEDGEAKGFAYGGTLYMRDGTERPSGFTDAQTEDIYCVRGKPEKWYEAVKLITSQGRPDLEAIVGLSFAAPLMHCMGDIYNSVMCFRSQGSAGYKTTATSVGLAVWGSPLRARESVESTRNSMLNKLGMLRNLPLYQDEVNDKERFPEVQKFMNLTSGGSEKGRMNGDGSQREKGTWQTVVGLASNSDFWDWMRTVQKQDSDAPFQRIFQTVVMKIPDTRYERIEVQRMIGKLDNNHGHAGAVYAKYIAMNYDTLYKATGDFHKKFEKVINARDEERFRSAIVATIIMGLDTANKCLGTDFHTDRVYQWLVRQYLDCRRRLDAMNIVAGSQGHVHALLDKFFTAHGPNMIWTDSMPTGAGKPKPSTLLHGPNDRDAAIFIRNNVSDQTIVFKKEAFEDFLVQNSVPVSETERGLKKFFGATVTKCTVTKGTSFPSGGQVDVFVLPIGLDSPLFDQLYKHTPISERPNRSGLQNALPLPQSGLTPATVAVSHNGPTGAQVSP
jgi:hypothetical protein